MRRHTYGFTLIELLIASAVALLILLVLGQTTKIALKINQREDQSIPQQQQLRASIEVIAQELRSSIGPRVTYPGVNGSGIAVPTGLSASSANSITLLVPVNNSTFVVAPPTGYPATPSIPARSATTIQNPSLTDATSSAVQCSAAFQGNEYAVLYSTQTTTYLPGNTRNPDAFRLLKLASSSPCSGSGTTVTLDHTPTPLPLLAWNPNTYIVEVTPITYSVVNGTLMRQIVGQAAQVVAYNISQLTLSYLPENVVSGLTNCMTATFYSAPGCAPRQITVTLTSTPQQSGISGVGNLSATQTVFLR